ncbi:MAG: hypothetical protein DI556_20205 [Rhodovulum sulfidophilum]|uniref:HTH lysR-type domain-containing protein n=1 Tax=Rhodovulum sulfidophilum TaxID=35806 RepID=A0A2W5N027_RHOSU|nr:MAG: hypothetical protein DI556_20205 [Rhodovulum sulfidophilum]
MTDEKLPNRHALRLQLILRNLPHILAAERAGSLHRAGERLGIAQSALSRRLAEVEGELGGPIFERSAAGVSPTEPGAAFCREAAQIMADLERAIRRFELNRMEGRMTLRIGFNSAAMMFPAMAAALRDFRQTHPRCDLRLASHLSEAQYRAVEAGELDVGVAFLLGDGLPFAIQPLAEDRIVLALPSDHALAARPLLSIGDLDGAPLISIQRETSGRLAEEVGSRLDAAGVRPREVMEAGSSEATLNLVAAGLGLAFVNRSQGGRLPPNVVLRDLEGFDLPLPVAAFWMPAAETPLIAAFAAALAEAFQMLNAHAMP